MYAVSYISLNIICGALPILIVAEVPVLCIVLLVNRLVVPSIMMVVIRLFWSEPDQSMW